MARRDPGSDRVKMDPDLQMESLATTPAVFRVESRNPEKSLNLAPIATCPRSQASRRDLGAGGSAATPLQGNQAVPDREHRPFLRRLPDGADGPAAVTRHGRLSPTQRSPTR